MTIAHDFIKKLQAATGTEKLPKKFLEDYVVHSDIITFQDFLDQYAEYCKGLSASQKEIISKIFWEQVSIVGTPIIEQRPGSEQECDVYFLMPKEKLSDSTEIRGIKKDIYLQGDFHVYSTTENRQRLAELTDTGIMWHRDSMPREAIIVYKFTQAEPSFRGKRPVPERSPFFENESLTPFTTHLEKFPTITQSDYRDEFSMHTAPYPGFASAERIFRVSTDSKQAYIQGESIDWPHLLNKKTMRDKKNFVYHATLYSDLTGNLHRSDASVTKQYHDDLHFSNGYQLSLITVHSFSEIDVTNLGEKPCLIKDETGKCKMWGYKENHWH